MQRTGPCCRCGKSIPWEDQYCIACERLMDWEQDHPDEDPPEEREEEWDEYANRTRGYEY